MALQRDGNSRNCVSRKPYDANNSFVKKMARKVTGLMGWPSESQAAVSQNRDSLSCSGDEDATNAKRLRVDIADTLCIPSTSRGINNFCSPIQPVNDLQEYSKNYRNKYLMSSTPAIQSSSDRIPLSGNKSDDGIPSASTSTQPTEYKSHGSSITDSFDINEFVDSSSTIPHLRIDQSHNVTVPAFSKDVPSQVSYQDKSKLFGSSDTNSRAPSFNVDVFYNSGRRLSASVCENRNSSSLSPFYSARTMYGGASTLLPYDKQHVGRIRSPYTSKLNLFSPRSSQITIQPVLSTKISDQETMSAAARRILDTLEKYCSPVMDAKKIPINESVKSIDSDTSLQSLSKGVKRKLQSLSQITPNTTDLLRIKRKEQMQDSVSNARQVVSNVSESSIVAGDSDSSDSVDLDYSILDESLKAANRKKYISKIRQKDNKIEDSPVSRVKLPNAVLKMTNLPKFDIADMFTFSKPVLVENLEQSVSEIINAVEDSSKNSEIKSQVSAKPAKSIFKPPNTNKPIIKDPSKPVPRLLAKSPVTSRNNNNYKLVSAPKPAPTFMSPSLTFTKNNTKVKTASWTCKVCLLESTEERCSSCTSTREQNTTPVQPSKTPEDNSALLPTIQTLPISNWEGKFKPPSNTWECKECFVLNSNNLTNCASCYTPSAKANDLACKESPKTNTKNQEADDGKPKVLAQPPSGTNDLWKNLQKSEAGSWICDSCWVQNKPSEVKCLTCGVAKEPTKLSSIDKVVEAPRSEFLFGMDKVDGPSPCTTLNIDKTLFGSGRTATTSGIAVTSKPTFTFGVSSTPSTSAMSAVSSSNETTSSTSTSTTTFSFGANNSATAAAPIQFSFGATKVMSPINTPSCNLLVDGFQGEKSVENKKDAPIFNDVSSSTSNTKSPLLQKKPETSSFSNNTNIFKTPKFSITKNVFANKENGENVNDGNTYSNISSSTSDSSLSKKNSFRVYESAAATATTPIIFCSNGFAKSDNATATGSNMTAVSSSVSNVFNTTLSPAATPTTITSKVNDQASIFTTKTDTEEFKVNNKDPRMFPSPTSRFVVSSSQQPNTNSVFGALTNDTGGFGSKKSDTQGVTTFNAASTFSFGLMSGTSSTQASQQPIGFSFNGPKAAERSTSKFVFGGSTNTFGNVAAAAAVAATATPTPFTFSTPPTTDGEQSRVNSLFSANPLKTLPEQQMNVNCAPTFGNSVFGGGAQQPQPIAKKSGGFNFAAPSGQSTSLQQQPINSFNSFTNSTNENQDQNRLIANAAPAFTPFVFGGANSQNAQAPNFNLTVPPTFNFSSGNALTSFTAQSLTNSNPTPAVATRKIRKAVRRTAK